MDPDPRKEIEVDPDPDLDPERGLKWIRIPIRPNAVDPGGSGSGSETLLLTQRFPLYVTISFLMMAEYATHQLSF